MDPPERDAAPILSWGGSSSSSSRSRSSRRGIKNDLRVETGPLSDSPSASIATSPMDFAVFPPPSPEKKDPPGRVTLSHGSRPPTPVFSTSFSENYSSAAAAIIQQQQEEDEPEDHPDRSHPMSDPFAWPMTMPAAPSGDVPSSPSLSLAAPSGGIGMSSSLSPPSLLAPPSGGITPASQDQLAAPSFGVPSPPSISSSQINHNHSHDGDDAPSSPVFFPVQFSPMQQSLATSSRSPTKSMLSPSTQSRDARTSFFTSREVQSDVGSVDLWNRQQETIERNQALQSRLHEMRRLHHEAESNNNSNKPLDLQQQQQQQQQLHQKEQQQQKKEPPPPPPLSPPSNQKLPVPMMQLQHWEPPPCTPTPPRKTTPTTTASDDNSDILSDYRMGGDMGSSSPLGEDKLFGSSHSPNRHTAMATYGMDSERESSDDDDDEEEEQYVVDLVPTQDHDDFFRTSSPVSSNGGAFLRDSQEYAQQQQLQHDIDQDINHFNTDTADRALLTNSMGHQEEEALVRLERHARLGRLGSSPRSPKITTNRIRIHVYNLIASETVMALPWGCNFPIGHCFSVVNSGLHALGTGAYHCGVEVNGVEYAFGANNVHLMSGVFTCVPMQSPGYEFRQTLDFGTKQTLRKKWVQEVKSPETALLKLTSSPHSNGTYTNAEQQQQQPQQQQQKEIQSPHPPSGSSLASHDSSYHLNSPYTSPTSPRKGIESGIDGDTVVDLSPATPNKRMQLPSSYREVETFVTGQSIMEQMSQEYMGVDYDLLRNNCCTFARDACLRLGVEEEDIPTWFLHLAETGAATEEVVANVDSVMMNPIRRMLSGASWAGDKDVVPINTHNNITSQDRDEENQENDGFEVIAKRKQGSVQQTEMEIVKVVESSKGRMKKGRSGSFRQSVTEVSPIIDTSNAGKTTEQSDKKKKKKKPTSPRPSIVDDEMDELAIGIRHTLSWTY